MERPKHGGRVLLELESASAGEVRYRVTLYSPGAKWSGTSAIQVDDGTVTMSEFGDCRPPEWLVEGAVAFLKTVWNARRKEPDPRWPRRIFRWRSPR